MSKIVCSFCHFPLRAVCLANLIFLDFIIILIYFEESDALNNYYFLHTGHSFINFLFNNNNNNINNNSKHSCPSALAFDVTNICICTSEITASVVYPNADYCVLVFLQIFLLKCVNWFFWWGATTVKPHISNSFLGAFSKLRKATISSFVMSVRPSVFLHWRNNWAPTRRIFVTLYICVFFENLSRKFKFH